jgi:hypothetical protein
MAHKEHEMIDPQTLALVIVVALFSFGGGIFAHMMWGRAVAHEASRREFKKMDDEVKERHARVRADLDKDRQRMGR